MGIFLLILFNPRTTHEKLKITNAFYINNLVFTLKITQEPPWKEQWREKFIEFQFVR